MFWRLLYIYISIGRYSLVQTWCWPDGLRVHLSSDLQVVEALHVADGIGQDLRRPHGWHLPVGLGQVAVHPQPWLETHRKENCYKVKEIMCLLTQCSTDSIIRLILHWQQKNIYPKKENSLIKLLILNGLSMQNFRNRRFNIIKK